MTLHLLRTRGAEGRTSTVRPLLSAVVIAALMTASPSAGQNVSVERDPFSTPEISETIEAADRDRVARITRDLVDARLVEIELRIIRELESRLGAQADRRIGESREAIIEELEARIAELTQVVSALREGIPGLVTEALATAAPEAAPEAGLPQGASFVACVDGRALYRDENGSTFYAEETKGESGVSRCSN